MRVTGAKLVRYALEQINPGWVLGIPGVHTTELFDELAASSVIQPLLVTHEGGAAFMADAISRTSNHIGTLLVVPGAGLTHAASGIAEAFLDGIPMLVLSGGINRAHDMGYQLHDIDQQALMAPITKGQWRVDRHDDVVMTIYQACKLALSGKPGPVYVELPVNVLLFEGDSGSLLAWPGVNLAVLPPESLVDEAVEIIESARQPGIFVGWGARHAVAELTQLAELIGAPVATTLQGLSSFPADHPLHAGMGFGSAAVPSAREVFAGCDCLIAVGTCFSEVGTGSYGVRVPENLIHIDIDPVALSRNYPARVGMAADSKAAVAELCRKLLQAGVNRDSYKLRQRIARLKVAYARAFQRGGDPQRVNPGKLFQSLDQLFPSDLIVVADDGNHTFLTAELMPMSGQRTFISPTDFNCMGYAIPAAAGARLANSRREVVAVVGDGAFLMTSNELLTATSNRLGMIVMVFADGELSQIAQAQEVPYNRKTCTVLKPLNLEAAAAMTGCDYLPMLHNDAIQPCLHEARELAAQGRVVLVEVRIDYSQKTAFTKGIVKTNVARMPSREIFRLGMRALTRRVTG